MQPHQFVNANATPPHPVIRFPVQPISDIKP
jgi:hypothetical protein